MSREEMNREEIDRALAEMLSAQSPDVPSPSDGLRPEVASAIERQMVQDLSPVRPLRPAGYYAAGFALIFLVPIMAGLGLLKASGLAAMGPAAIAIVFSGLAICAGLLALSLAAEMSPGSRRPAPPVPLAAGILLGLAVLFGALLPFGLEAGFLPAAGKCLLLGIGFAVPAAALAWILLRRGAVLSAATSGTAAGLFGGLAGVAVLEIHCPDLNAAHILAAHWGAALVCAAAGWLSARWGTLYSLPGSHGAPPRRHC